MRKNQINGIINDFLHFKEEINPLNNISIRYKLKMDLKINKLDYPEEDDIVMFYKKKAEWLLDRINKLGGNAEDFEEIKIIVLKRKEKLILKYGGQKFEKEFYYKNNYRDKAVAEFRKAVKKLKPIDLSTNKK